MRVFERLISSFRKMPGVGPKQAERFALYVARAPEGEISELLEAVEEIRNAVKPCPKCFSYSDGGLCDICSDNQRIQNIICVVENVQDLEAIEKTGFYKGLYHVLGGVISPAQGLGETSIRLKELIKRTEELKVNEIIVAVNPSAEGETTAAYIKTLLEKKVEKISRIAFGVPLGGDINYLDELTLTHALQGRRKI
ncbi:MAG: recombination protein RecR [Elusimicrobia bacterium]|nr:recombination protein RecR [Elusimicrobiota bacterium]